MSISEQTRNDSYAEVKGSGREKRQMDKVEDVIRDIGPADDREIRDEYFRRWPAPPGKEQIAIWSINARRNGLYALGRVIAVGTHKSSVTGKEVVTWGIAPPGTKPPEKKAKKEFDRDDMVGFPLWVASKVTWSSLTAEGLQFLLKDWVKQRESD